jgi:hypothetical protein
MKQQNAKAPAQDISTGRSVAARCCAIVLAASLLAFAQSPAHSPQSSAAPLLHFRDVAAQAGLTTVPHFDADNATSSK